MRSRADSAKAAPASGGPSSLWRPLHTPLFRNLLLADAMSDTGTFMQSVGAAWLMVSLAAGPIYVALTQTASALPFFLFALPAGAVGDIVDRRKLILFTELWMAAVAIVLAVLTIAGLMSPALLLGLTFALVAGVGAAFALNVLSFFGVIVLVARWKRPVRHRTTPPETVAGATVAALRYVRFSPSLRGMVFRSGLTMFFASALIALMPLLSKTVSDSPTGYGILLGCFGAGAILGALTLQPARARWSDEAVASGGVAILGMMTASAGFLHAMSVLAAAMLVAGAAWIVFISLVTTLMQTLAPDWVRARVLAIFMLVFQGGLAAGSALWGAVAVRADIQHALLWAGLGVVATTALGLVSRLPDATTDVSPWNHWRMPAIVKDLRPDFDEGPVLVTVEYRVSGDRREEFLEAIHKYGRIRRRDGAFRWGIYRDLEDANRYVETFLVTSWAEHLRQHERSTKADREAEERLRMFVTAVPNVRHLVSA